MPIIHTSRSIFKSPEKIIAHPVSISQWNNTKFSKELDKHYEDIFYAYNQLKPFTLGSVEYVAHHPYIFANLIIKEDKNSQDFPQATKSALKNLRDYAIEQDCINEIAFIEVTDTLKDAIKAILGDYTVHIYHNTPFPEIPKMR